MADLSSAGTQPSHKSIISEIFRLEWKPNIYCWKSNICCPKYLQYLPLEILLFWKRTALKQIIEQMVLFVLFIIQESKSIRHILSGTELAGSMRNSKFSQHRKESPARPTVLSGLARVGPGVGGYYSGPGRGGRGGVWGSLECARTNQFTLPT